MPQPKKPVKRKPFRPGPRKRSRPVKRATVALMLSLSFLLGCKAKPVRKPFTPSRPPAVKKVELPKLEDFRAFAKAFEERLKTESPEKIALEYPAEQRKKIVEALTFLAKAKRPETMEARVKEINSVLARVERFINEQTRLDRASMLLLAEQWVRDYALKDTVELLEERLALERKASVPNEFEYDARAVTLEIIYRLLQHRLAQAK